MALLGVLPACGFGNSDATDAGPGGEAVVEIDASFCYGTFERVCFPAAPTDPVLIAVTENIDTANNARCNPTASLAEHYCVIAGPSFTISPSATLRAYGSKPLILISTTAMFDLAGVIDVSSNVLDPNTGAGTSTAECAAGTAATMNSGGFGGSLSGQGGDGKQIDGAAGAAPLKLASFPGQLRAGCAGSPGAGMTGGAGGAGGGAVAIIAPTIQMAGHIDASGAGGHGGGPNRCGGGGGGSGGMVVLESPTITGVGAFAMIYANGGGGGQGGENKVAGDGASGQDPPSPSQAALGGKNGTTNSSPTTGGGGGAAGAAGNSVKDGDDAVGNANGEGGGGGGGGAAGFVRAHGATNVTIAPTSDPL